MIMQDTPSGKMITDFSKISRPTEHLAGSMSRHQWELVTYSTTACDGTMLFSRAKTTPQPVTFETGLQGWHRIYVCLFSGEAMKCCLSLRLDGDPAPAYFTQGHVNPGFWSAYENCEESFWKCADLTGKQITVAKPYGTAAAKIGLMWLRFEPMSEEEVKAHCADFTRRDTRRLHAHSDMDWISMARPFDMDEYCSMIEEYAAADVEVASVEVYSALADFSRPDTENADLYDSRAESQAALDKCRKEVYTEYLRRARGYGIKLYAAHRMGLSNFVVPYDMITCASLPFAQENPQWYCRDRDGEAITFLSYAFRETQDFMIARFMEMIELGFEGATLILTRGIHLLFEEPVLARFRELYPDADPCRLSLDDPRLSRVRCEIMTGFVRRLRKAFDKYSNEHNRPRLAINPIICYGITDNLRLGIDPETWAAEGLVDSFVVANMKTWEEEELFRDDTDPSLLSVEKYAEAKRRAAKGPISRHHGNDLELMISNCPDYMEIARKHGVKIYFEMPWEGTTPPEELRNYAMRLYAAGAENLSLWDCYVLRVIHRPEWQISSKLGHKNELAAMPDSNAGYRSLYRITTLNGRSLASYNPSWRG